METIIGQFSNLGVGVASIAVIYLIVSQALKLLHEQAISFREYVEANNHKSVEVMTECRDAIKAASKNIEKSTDIMQEVFVKGSNRRNNNDS